MPRNVADTNIYISSLNFAGTADEVLALGRAGLIEICISPAILDEIAGVLGSQVPLVRAACTRSDAGDRQLHGSRPSAAAGETHT